MGTDILIDFSAIFTRETTLVTSCFAFLHTKPLLKRGLYKERKEIYSIMKEFAPFGSKFFPYRVDPFLEERQK